MRTLKFLLILLLGGLLPLMLQAQKSVLSHKQLATEALAYCQKNNMETEFYLLVDMRIHSGKNRLFVWDFAPGAASKSGICTHGTCKGNWAEEDSKIEPHFSNVPESHCSSLGKYRIGKRGWSNWGIHINYKLHGLERTNNKAFDRIIVLHSWDAVGDKEIFPQGAPESWGCPSVSNAMMRQLDELLQRASKPVLLWVVW